MRAGFSLLLPLLLSRPSTAQDCEATATTTETDHVTVTDYVTSISIETIYMPFPTYSPTDGSSPNTGVIVPSTYGVQPSNAGPSFVMSVNSPQPSGAGYSGSGTSGSGGSGSSTSPVPTLVPVVPPGINTADLSRLQPVYNGTLLYTQDGVTNAEVQHLFAQVNAGYQYPTVVLPHSTSISDISCVPNNGGLDIAFTSPAAYQYAKQVWTPFAGTGFILVTDPLGCSAADNGMHAYWQITKLTFDDATNSVIAQGFEVATEDTFDEVHVIWGQYVPSGGSPSTTPVSYNPPTSVVSSNSSTTAVNSTAEPNYGANSSLVCSAPPSTYLGLTTAVCGDNFDSTLDAALGYIDPSNTAAMNAFAPGLGDEIASAIASDPSIVTSSRRDHPARRFKPDISHMHKRHWWSKVTHAISTATHFVEKVVTKAAAVVAPVLPIAEKVLSVAAPVAHVFAKAAGLVIQTVARVIPIPDPGTSFDRNIPVNIGPFGSDSSLFAGQPALYLFGFSGNLPDGNNGADLDLYCVDCGFTANIATHGELSYSIKQGHLSKADFSMNGNIWAGFGLGLNGDAQVQKPFKKNLIEEPVPELGFKVGDLFEVGFIMTQGVEVDIGFGGQGSIWGNAAMKIPDFQLTLDAVNHANNHVSGWTPHFSSTYGAVGTVNATVQLGFPFGLEFGLKVPPIDLDLTVGISDTPGVGLSGSYTNDVTQDCYKGIDFTLYAYDELNLEVIGVDIQLASASVGLYSTCVGAQAVPTTSTTTLTPTLTNTGSATALTTLPILSVVTTTITAPTVTQFATTTSLSTTTSLVTTTIVDPSTQILTAVSTITNTQIEYITVNASSTTPTTSSPSPTTTTTCYAFYCPPKTVDGRYNFGWLNYWGNGVVQCNYPIDPVAGTFNWCAYNQNSGSFVGQASDYDECVEQSVPGSCVSGTNSAGYFGYSSKRRGIRGWKRDNETESASNSTVTSNLTMTNGTTASNTTNVTTANSTTNASNATASFNSTSSNSTASNNTNSAATDSMSIMDATGQFVLSYDDTGNFGFQSAANATGAYPFTVVGNTVYQVGTNNTFMFFYPAEYAATGASRFRTGDLGSLPVGSEMVVLSPLVMGDGSTLLMPISLVSNTVLTPVYCAYAGVDLGGKVFLVDPNNIQTAISTLMAVNTEFIITGGIVSSCTPVTWTGTMPGNSTAS